MSLSERSTLGRYRIVRRLGAGAMGEVYLAEDPHIDRQLALKTVRLGDGGAIEVEERRVRLMREAKAAGKLVHPYVVALFDAGEAEDGVFYLAFEYVGGPDLAARQRLQPPLTLGEVLRIGREAAEGLDAAHRQGIVHRDIKPSNIMLDTSGQVKIGDFGIAKMLGQATELTQTGSVVGSPHYLSPEQVRGEELDGRSDLFSLGVVLYELLTRTRPFAGETITTLVYQILSREPLPILGMRPGLPERVERIVSRLLQKDREQRFASGRELADEIAACERELPRDVLDCPAAVVPGELGDTVRMSSSGASAMPPLPPPGAAGAEGQALPAASGGSLGTPEGQPAMEGTAPTRAWSPPGVAATGGAGVPPPPLGSGGTMAAAGAAVPGSGSYGPASARRFPWGIVAALLVVALLGAGFLVGGLLWLRNGGLLRGAGGQVAEASTPDELATIPASAPLPVPPGSGEPPAPQPPVTPDVPPAAEPLEVPPGALPTAPAALPAPASGATVDEPPQPSRPQPELRADPAPAKAPATPRPAPTRAAPARPAEPVAEPPARPAPVPPPDPDPEPEPQDAPRFDREIQSSLAVKFAVQPPEAVVSVRREGDRRFTVIGRAGDYDAGKKKLPAYDLNGPGVHYVRIVHEGREVIYRLEAQLGSQVTTITANLAPAGPRRR
jgi:hypothetical protein